MGSSSATDGTIAADEVCASALIHRDPRLLIVFASDACDLETLLEQLRHNAGSTPIIGCSTAGEIVPGGPRDASVVAIVLGGDGFSVATTVGRNASTRLRAAGADAAASLRDTAVRAKRHRVLLLLSDGLGGDQQEVVRGAYAVAGAGVPLVGGCAGDDLKMQRTFQMVDDEVLSDAVVGAAIGSDAPFGIGVRHGWQRVGDPMLITKSVGSRVLTIDDQPALDAYLARLDAPPEAGTDAAAFTRFALTHPLGLVRRGGEEVRFIAGADLADRSIGCIASVPQGALAWLMEGDVTSVLAATDGACRDALAELDGHDPLGVIAFDCIARRGVLGDQGISREVDHIESHTGSVPLAGFYTYGEIARTHGTGGFHNQTLVVLAVA
ncbi:MAG: hypothetical protein QOH79_961 [Acidimicrobiaceae bacterium]